jgi:hypothetical protein
MESKTKKIKPDMKQRIKYQLYHKRSNCYIPGPTAPDGERYLIEFNALADCTKSLIDVFLLFFPSIYEIDPSVNKQIDPKILPFNLLFRYMVELYHLHDKYIPSSVKTTEEELVNVQDILGNKFFQYIHEDELKKQIRELNY